MWRRRSCKNAHKFTTTEQADLSELLVDKHDDTQEPFDTYKLGLSLSKCGLTTSEVVELQRTIITNVLKHIDADMTATTSTYIADTAYSVLRNYDVQYANRYKSYSQQLTD